MKNLLRTTSDKVGEFTGVQVFKVLRKNFALYPIAVIHVFAMTIAMLTIARTLIKSPDITINKSKREMPFEHLWTQDGHAVQYKMLSYQNMGKWTPDPDRPNIDEPEQRFR